MELICTDENGSRRVTHREAAALIYTFGVEVGKFLIDTIRIKYAPNLPPHALVRWIIGEKKRGYVAPLETSVIHMRSDYDPGNLRWLGVFIHEAVHIWQAHTWQNIGDWQTPDYDYSESQLTFIDDLGLEEFPTAVQDWFYVNYGLEACLIGKYNEIGKYTQVDTDWVWKRVTEALGSDYQRGAGEKLEDLQRKINPKYQGVIDKVRKPKHPRVPIEVPTPFPLDHPSDDDDEQFGVGAAFPDPTEDPFSSQPEHESEPITRIHGPRFDVSIPPATQTGFRRVNQRQAMALVYTFGGEVGSSLIGAIEIAKGDSDLTGSKTKMILPSTHNSEDLSDLGEFIRKAARIWQQRTGRHATGPQWTAEGEVGEDYYHRHLQSLALNSRQHAKAVQDWFYPSYGTDYCLIGVEANQMGPGAVWDPIKKAAGFEHEQPLAKIELLLKGAYAGLIEELRDPEVGQNAPYPAG